MSERTIDIIIPTLKRIHAFKCLQYLYEVKWPYRLHLITEGNTWAQAINIGLDRVGDNDVIIMDDDVMINEDTFSLIDYYYDEADIFGFKLLFPSGLIQHAGASYKPGLISHIGYYERDDGQYNIPKYVCHSTHSLCYMKNQVIKELKCMDETIPGIGYVDADFNFRALKKGFKIMYLPSPAVHMESATKKYLFSGIEDNTVLAFNDLKKKHLMNLEFENYLGSFPKDVEECTNESITS